MGIMIGDRKHWGHGIGLNAWTSLIKHLFIKLKIRKITAGTLRPNISMIKIMERSGMLLEAIRPKHYFLNGEAEDVFCYAKFTDV